MESAVVKSDRIQRWDYEVYGTLAQEAEQLLQSSPWPIVRLRQAATRIWCGSTPRSGSSIERTDGIPFIKTFNVQEGWLDLTTIYRVSSDAVANKSDRLAKPGDVLFNIIGATLEVVGRATVIPEELRESYLNQNVAAIRLKKDINPEYISICLQTQLLKKQIAAHSKQGNQVNFSTEEVRDLRLPLPPRPIQDRIAAIMQEAYAARQAMLAEAEVLLGEIDSYVLGELGIDLRYAKEPRRFALGVQSLEGGRFDVAFNMGFHKYDPYPALTRPVQDVAEFSTETTDPTRSPDESFMYVDIASIDTALGLIVAAQELLGRDAPSRARKVIHHNELLVSTVRPTRRAVALVTLDLDGHICSTGFAVLRAKTEVAPEYLHIALRLEPTAEQFGRYTTGSSYPAILEKDIARTLIPVPKLDKQWEIVNKVIQRCKKAGSLRVQAESVLVDAKTQVEQVILSGESDDGVE